MASAATSLSPKIELDLRHIRERVELALEIGCYHGATTNLLCDRYLSPSGKVVVVDPLRDGVYIDTEPSVPEIVKAHETRWRRMFKSQFDVFEANTARNAGKIEIMRMLSTEAFPLLLERYVGQIDLIYIDGDHRAASVWEDAVNAYALCKVGGHILFDDYLWGKEFPPEQTPKPAIDRFLREYSDRCVCVSKGYRVLVKKIR